MHTIRLSVRLGFVLALGMLASLEAFGDTTGQSLALDNLDAWRAPLGEWAIAGDTALDPADDVRLEGEPGKGVVLNGPTGRTRHLFSKADRTATLTSTFPTAEGLSR